MLILLPRASLLKVLSSLPRSKETYKYDIIFRKQTVGRRILNREFYLHRILEQIKKFCQAWKNGFSLKMSFQFVLMACDLCIPDRNYNSYHQTWQSYATSFTSIGDIQGRDWATNSSSPQHWSRPLSTNKKFTKLNPELRGPGTYIRQVKRFIHKTVV